jgi:hypothetical protein
MALALGVWQGEMLWTTIHPSVVPGVAFGFCLPGATLRVILAFLADRTGWITARASGHDPPIVLCPVSSLPFFTALVPLNSLHTRVE